MTEPRRGIFQLKDWLQLLLSIAAVVSLAVATMGYLFLTWTDWREVPDRISSLEEAQGRLIAQINVNTPEFLSFLGNGVVPYNRVEAGGSIQITYVARKNVSCRSTTLVRFFNHSNNTMSANTSEIPSVSVPVSRTYSSFTINVKIPEDLPPGVYSYHPEITPDECGIYSTIVPPMSEAFEVVRKEN